MYGIVKFILSPRSGSMAKNPMSAISFVTASTDLAAVSKTTVSRSTPSLAAN